MHSLEHSKGKRAWPLLMPIMQGKAFASLYDPNSPPGFGYLSQAVFECFRKYIDVFLCSRVILEMRES